MYELDDLVNALNETVKVIESLLDAVRAEAEPLQTLWCELNELYNASYQELSKWNPPVERKRHNDHNIKMDWNNHPREYRLRYFSNRYNGRSPRRKNAPCRFDRGRQRK